MSALSQTILLDSQELAARWRVSPGLLTQWRWHNRGPNFLKIGDHVLYRLQDIKAVEKEKEKILKETHQKEQENIKMSP